MKTPPNCMVHGALLVACLGITAAQAQPNATAGHVTGPTDVALILQEQDRIEARLRRDSADDAHLGADRARIAAAQALIRQRVAGVDSLRQLRPDDRADVVNAISAIRAIVGGDDDERIVCKRDRTIGSNISKRACMSVADRKRQIAQARAYFDRNRVCDLDACTVNLEEAGALPRGGRGP